MHYYEVQLFNAHFKAVGARDKRKGISHLSARWQLGSENEGKFLSQMCDWHRFYLNSARLNFVPTS